MLLIGCGCLLSLLVLPPLALLGVVPGSNATTVVPHPILYVSLFALLRRLVIFHLVVFCWHGMECDGSW